MINLLLEISSLSPNSTVLDVGCGIGGTTRHLARDHGCTVTGITISGRQVQIAKRLTDNESSSTTTPTSNNSRSPDTHTNANADKFTPIGTRGGRVQYRELDAEKMDSDFPPQSFDCVWISEALSHFPDKPLFFRNAARLLRPGGTGKLVIADWFKAEDLDAEAMESDIKPIEGTSLSLPLPS